MLDSYEACILVSDRKEFMQAVETELQTRSEAVQEKIKFAKSFIYKNTRDHEACY